MVVCRYMQARTALTYGCYVNGPPEDPNDSPLLFLSVTEKDARVARIDPAEVQQAILLTGFSSLLRHSTENLREKREK